MTRRLTLLALLGCSSLAMADDTTIPAVTVSAPSTDTATSSTSATTTISQAQIANSPDTSLTELLQKESAVRIANNSGDTSQQIISIRGFGDNAEANSLILVDGFPLMNASLLAPNYNALLLSDMQHISIDQGSHGALWGDQAVGGVLSIDTLQPDKPTAIVEASTGSYDKQFFNGLWMDHLSNGFFYKVSGFSDHTDNYRAHNQQGNSGFAAQEGFDYATGFLRFDQKIYEDSYRYPGSLTQQQYDSDPQQATDTQDYVHSKTQIYQVLSSQSFNDDWLLETRVSATNIQRYGWFYSPFNNNESLYWFNPKLTGRIGQSHWTFGYVGSTSYYTSYNDSVASKAYALENDVYTQTIMPILPQWDLTLGARYAQQNNEPQIVIGEPEHYVNRVFVSEQGLAFHINPVWTWFIRRDGNFRFPKANEEVWLASDQTELKPQTGVSYESGFKWQTPRQHGQVNVYELWLHNEIAYDPTQTPTQPFGATSNFDTTLRKGISISDVIKLAEPIDVDGQVNYVDARFMHGPDSGNVVPAVPTWSGVAGVDYRFQPDWQTSFHETYSGSAFASDDVGNVAPKTAAYWLSQWALQYHHKAYTVSLQVNNLFNQHYAIYTDYSSFTQSNSYYPGAGRNFSLNVKADLV